eukprot:s691_g12.t1
MSLDGPHRVWDRDFGHADFEDSDFEDYDPPAIELEISQQVMADESVEDSDDDDDVILVADTLNDIETVEDVAMPEPYTQPAADTQASQERLLQPHELGKQILADLERIPDKEWENKSRKNVRPNGEAKCLQKTLGLVVGAHWRGIPMPTTDTLKFRKLTRNILLDKNNKGPSWIFGLGDWTEGGETFVQDHAGTEEYELQEDIRDIGPKGKVLHGFKRDIHTLQKFDGTKIHCTVPFEGTRYAIILYAINRSYHETPALVRALSTPRAGVRGKHSPGGRGTWQGCRRGQTSGRRTWTSQAACRSSVAAVEMPTSGGWASRGGAGGAAGCRAGTTCDGPLSQAHRARCTGAVDTFRCGYIEKHEITQARSSLADHLQETWEERGVSEAQMGGTVPFLSSRCAR